MATLNLPYLKVHRLRRPGEPRIWCVPRWAAGGTSENADTASELCITPVDFPPSDAQTNGLRSSAVLRGDERFWC